MSELEDRRESAHEEILKTEKPRCATNIWRTDVVSPSDIGHWDLPPTTDPESEHLLMRNNPPRKK